MGTVRTDEFRKEAVRIALTSGLSRRQVADDLGGRLFDLEQMGERAPWYGCGLCHGLQSSMSGKGNCYGNAVVETFFRTIKAELVWRRTWETRRQAETGIFQYINGFYNPRRRHSALGGKSPLAFERQAA